MLCRADKGEAGKRGGKREKEDKMEGIRELQLMGAWEEGELRM